MDLLTYPPHNLGYATTRASTQLGRWPQLPWQIDRFGPDFLAVVKALDRMIGRQSIGAASYDASRSKRGPKLGPISSQSYPPRSSCSSEGQHDAGELWGGYPSDLIRIGPTAASIGWRTRNRRHSRTLIDPAFDVVFHVGCLGLRAGVRLDPERTTHVPQHHPPQHLNTSTHPYDTEGNMQQRRDSSSRRRPASSAATAALLMAATAQLTGAFVIPKAPAAGGAAALRQQQRQRAAAVRMSADVEQVCTVVGSWRYEVVQLPVRRRRRP